MKPIAFAGEAFSEYFCTSLLWDDSRLRGRLDSRGAADTLRRVQILVRQARRELRERRQATSTRSLLLDPLAALLGWRLGAPDAVVTGEDVEEAGAPLLDDDGQTLARVRVIAPGADFDLAPTGLHRRFAPGLSMVRVLQEEALTWGILANAHELRLIRRSEGFIASHVAFSLLDLAENAAAAPDVWRLMWALLRRDAWQSPAVADEVVRLSRDHQAKVGTGLGQQVRQAVETLLQAVVTNPENQDRLPALTPQVLRDLYAQALRLLYRLLFVLYAEARNLVPMDLPTYRDGYSLARLIDLIGDPRTDPRRPGGARAYVEPSLRALFELLKNSRGTDLSPEGVIPAYSGGLFEELRARSEQVDLHKLAWGDANIAQVLHLLTRVPTGAGELRVSYRELDVEQLGSIYEALLELTPLRADDRMWRAVVDGREVVITDAQRADLARRRGEVVDAGLLEEEDDEHEADAEEENEDEEQPEDDEEEEDDTRPAGRQKPVRILSAVAPGTVFLRPAMGRKQTGSYYTNRAIVEFLVRRTLDPLAENRSADRILGLRVVDPAMGSGHFLVGACHHLAAHLLAAYRRQVEEYRQQHPESLELFRVEEAGVPDVVGKWWDRDEEQVLAACRLLVAGHCIYGVDKNPLAVELARVSLWLATAARGNPLVFLDHRLRRGDSLLGLPADEIVRPAASREVTRRRSRRARQEPLEEVFVAAHRQMRERLRRALQHLGALRESMDAAPEDLEGHRVEFTTLLGEVAPLWHLHELRVGQQFLARDHPAADSALVNSWLDDFGRLGYITRDHLQHGEDARKRGEGLAAFSWHLAFPNVFADADGEWRGDAGFDAVLSNPPWEKVIPDRKEFHAAYDPLIREVQGSALTRRIQELHRLDGVAAAWAVYETEQRTLAVILGRRFEHQRVRINGRNTGGHPDLFKFFVERGHQLLRSGGAAGLVVPSGLHSNEGATGLRRLLLDQSQVVILCKFDNERKVFPGTDHRFKFDLVVFRKGGPSEEFPAIFLSWETEEALERVEQHPGLVRLTPDLIRSVSPDTLTIPEYRSMRDVEVVRGMHEHGEPLGRVMDRWGLQARQEVNMTSDSYLFRDRDWLRARGCTQLPGERWRAADEAHYAGGPYVRRGEGWVREDEQDDPNAPVVYAGEEYLPLMEGKFIHQFDHYGFAYVRGQGRARIVTRPLSFSEKAAVPHYFVATRDYLGKVRSRPLLKAAFRDVTHTGNERTMLCALLPGGLPCNHKLPVTSPQRHDADASLAVTCFVGVVNSFVFDYMIRLVGSVGLYAVAPLPFPGADEAGRLQAELLTAVCRLSCFTPDMAEIWNTVASRLPGFVAAPWDLKVAVTEPQQRARLRATVDAIAAELYALTTEEYAYIIWTYRLLDRIQPVLEGDRFLTVQRGGRTRYEPRSYITRDLALLTYCERRDVEPPTDIVEFYARAGVDIEPITGPIRDLRERVERATALGAVAYVPTPARGRGGNQ